MFQYLAAALNFKFPFLAHQSHMLEVIIWAQKGIGPLGQQRRRPACAFAQSDHRHCYLESKVASLATRKIIFELISVAEQPRFVGKPKDRLSRKHIFK